MRLLITILVTLLSFPALAAERKYAEVTIQSLSNALFKTGVLRPTDPAAVDEYIRIHQCGIYEQYGANDLAWTRLREAQARELGFLVPELNEYLEVVGTITLDRYDITQNAFLLTPQTQLSNMGIVSVAEYRSGSFDPCVGEQYKSFVPRVHPLRLTARLSNPLTLLSLPMSQQTADTLIKSLNGRAVQQEDQRRVVTMVLRIRLTGADPLSGAASMSEKTVTADLEEVLVFEGPDRKIQLFQRSFIDQTDMKKQGQ